MQRIWKAALLISFFIIVDQLTKGAVQGSFYWGESMPVIPDFFDLTYVKNTGAAFGMGADASSYMRGFFFLFLPVIACFFLAYLIVKSRHTHPFLCYAYALILSGAIGNLIDRFSLGYVVDFLDFYYKNHHYPGFNIADSCITLGGIMLVWDYLMEWKKSKNEEGQKGSEA